MKTKAGRPKLSALKRRMKSAIASFHRIPDECDLDWVECKRRLKRMGEARIRYHLSLQSREQ